MLSVYSNKSKYTASKFSFCNNSIEFYFSHYPYPLTLDPSIRKICSRSGCTINIVCKQYCTNVKSEERRNKI